jgi:hypothetical protein
LSLIVKDYVPEFYLARILPTPTLLPTGGVGFSATFRSKRMENNAVVNENWIYQKVVLPKQVIDWVLLFEHHISHRNQRYNLNIISIKNK